jgi:ligand-binding sensor domain-containing protein/signal transduction histidine kinase
MTDRPVRKTGQTVRLAVSIVASCLLTAHALPQQSVHAVDYARTLWKVADGLPEDTVESLVESPDGSLWIGTTGGLAKTGGGRIRTPISTPSVMCMALALHSLWIGTEGGGLLQLTGRHTRVFAAKDGLANGFVRTIFQDTRGRLWVGTDRGLFFLKGERLERVRIGFGTPDFAVHSILEDHEGRLWIGGAELISIAPDGHQEEYPLPGRPADRSVTTLLETSDRTLWVGMPRGLATVTRGQVHTARELSAPVRALLRDRDGMLWIGTEGGGLWTLKGPMLKRIQSPGMLPSETILSLLQDQLGQTWIGTRAGLVRLEKSPLLLVSIPNSSDHGAETVTGDNFGHIWVAARHVYSVQGNAAREVDYGIRNLDVHSIYHSHDGAIWLGTEDRGVYRVYRSHVDHYSAPQQLPNNNVRAFMERTNGEIWVATEDGVSVLGRDQPLKLKEGDGLAYASARTILEDKEGTIWIGTDRGLSAWRAGHFLPNDATRALSQEKIWSILEDRQGTLWFGSREHGLFRYKGGSILRYSTERGLPTNSIYKILQDKSGTFWVSGPNIIFSLQESELESTAESTSPLNPVLYAIPSDGVQMYGGQEPAGWLAPDGTVWFPSNRGLAHISVSPAPSISWVPRIWQLSEEGYTEPIPNLLRIPAAQNKISFRLMAVYLRPQDALRFRYKIDGIDSAWTQIKPDELVTYTNLKHGHYRMRLQAIDFATVGAISERIIDIDKPPYYYQTWWFYLFCIANAGLLVWLVYSFRLRQVRSRFNAVLQERARLAREMHDTVIQGCTGLSVLIEAILNADSDEKERHELLAYARELTSSTVNQARQAVWTVRHRPESTIDIHSELRSIAEQTRRDHRSIHVSLELRENVSLPSSIAHELIMTVRESLYNAIQHSSTDRILVSSWCDGEELKLSVQDYGVGISSETHGIGEEGHYGIVGMRERMKRIGGNFDLQSQQGIGTKVTISVACSRAFKRAEVNP